MVGRFGFSIGEGAAQRGRLKENVVCPKEEPVASGLLRGSPHGMSFSQPASGQRVDVNHFQSAMRLRGCGDSIHSLAGSVGGAIIDRDHFIVAVIKREKAGKRL